jgi:hypothetical protein
VLVGDLLRRIRRHHGSYCVPHAVDTSRDLRSVTGEDVWFTVIGSATGARP